MGALLLVDCLKRAFLPHLYDPHWPGILVKRLQEINPRLQIRPNPIAPVRADLPAGDVVRLGGLWGLGYSKCRLVLSDKLAICLLFKFLNRTSKRRPITRCTDIGSYFTILILS